MRLADDGVRAGYAGVAGWLKTASPETVASRKLEAEHFFRRIGITFNVYGDAAGAERLIPFDIIPRILTSREWTILRSTPSSAMSTAPGRSSRPASCPKN
jgi:uncharacterized circularly permuted ATP-grasp superfamily protein